jgi:hypothetical protein
VARSDLDLFQENRGGTEDNHFSGPNPDLGFRGNAMKD